MRCPILPLTLVLLSTIGPASASEHTISVGDLERSYLLHLPAGNAATAEEPLPLVIVYHGGGGNADSMFRLSGLNDKADEAGFIVAYPNGTGRIENKLTWNGGMCCGYAMHNEIDDVAFTNALIDELIKTQHVDPKRVYATGMSNGGIVSYYVANHLADRIAAIAPVAGTMGTETCEPSRPVPVMHFHGTDDQFLDYNGGPGPESIAQSDFYSVDHTIENWIKANHCEPTPVEESLPDPADDGCTVKRFTYSPKDNTKGAPVVLIRIENGGHTWPGAAFSPPFLGTLCRDINANDLMWEFFESHSLDD
ncbi:MAG: PHB depolymerase family esterase [Verrucomicrobiota bacterium]